jgi:hypothetical protein
LPIAGFALKENKFDGIYIGRRKGNDLVYAGKVDHGFDAENTKELRARTLCGVGNHRPFRLSDANTSVRDEIGLYLNGATGEVLVLCLPSQRPWQPIASEAKTARPCE